MGVFDFMQEVQEAVKDLEEQRAEMEKQRENIRSRKWRRR